MPEKEKKPKETKKVSRREFLGTSLKAGAGIAAASVASKFLRSDKYSPHSIFASEDKKIEYTPKAGLAPGMIGGPTGFEGAERYQYSGDEAAGRAVEGLRKLKADGKAPDKFVVMVPPGAVGHWESPFPEGAPPAKQVFFEETGIEVNIAFLNKGLTERLLAEGKRTPADVILTADMQYLAEAVEAGVTQAVESEVLTANVPEAFRGAEHHWFGLTSRARIVYASRDRVAPGEVTTYAWDWASGLPEMLVQSPNPQSPNPPSLYLVGHDTLGRFADGEGQYLRARWLAPLLAYPNTLV